MTANLEKLVAAGDVNPLKSDAELAMMLKKLDKVTKFKTFQRWKHKFLERLEQYLYEAGIDPADKAGTNLDRMLTKFVKAADKVTDHIDKGELSDERKTVKASLSLNEMCKQLTDVVETLKTLIPSTSKEEKQKGFTKFHLGAALIRQGFHQYQSMVACQEATSAFTEKLAHVADKQQLELFDYYTTWVERFCAVMADLGLYNVMMKCLEFAEAPEEEESSDEEDIHIEIEVTTPEGLKRLKLELDPRETIGNIKDAISGDIGIEPEKQIMKFKGNVLDNDKASLKDCGIVNKSKLTVEPFKIPITVNTYDGQSIPLLIDPGTYMSDIKRMVEKESSVPARNQKLFFKGEECDNDFNKAEDYGIEAGSVLDMEPKSIKVNVEMPDGEMLELNLSPDDTDDDIKAKIEEATGMAQPRQVLKAGPNREKMPKGIKIKDLGIKDGSPIKVEVFKVPITVNTHDGKKIETMVDPTMFMSDLKRQLEPESGVPARNQKLSLQGQELADDTKRAEDYGIKDGTVLDLEPKTIKVTVEMPDGDQVELEVSPSDTPALLKTKIEEATGMEPPKQVLKFDGNEMPDSKALKELGVKDGSKINVEIFKVPVTVKTYDGKTIEVMVDPTMYMSDLKRQLEPEAGIPAKNQKLFKGGDELGDDTKKARDYSIEGGTELYLEPKKMMVTVDMPDGTQAQVEITPDDSSDDIKKKIEAETGMAVPRQVLKKDGNELPNGKAAKDMGIQDGDNLGVDIFTIPVTVNTMDGKKIKVDVEPTQKLQDIKKKLEEEAGIPWDNQELFKNGNTLAGDNKTVAEHGIEANDELDLEPKKIKVTVDMPDGSRAEVELKPSDTGDDIKQKIEAKTGMAAPRQVLKKDGAELPVGQSVKDMGIREGDNLGVDVYTVPVTVKTIDGKEIKIDVDPTDKLGDIKKQLEEESGIPWDNQRLYKDDKELAEDDKTAKDHGIGEGDELYLEPKKMTVTVDMPTGNKVEVEITPDDTSGDIKAKIEAKTGMAAPRQVLKKDGAELPDGTRAKDMGVWDGDNLSVDVFTVPVTVKTMDGKEIKINVDPTDKLGDIKKHLQNESGIPWDNQRLYKDDKELAEDDKTAKDHGIGEGDELFLEPKKMMLTVDMPDGSKATVEITPQDTSGVIKNKIEAKTGMAAPRQVLKKNGAELPDGRSAKDMGLQDGDNLAVDVFTVPVTVNTMDGKQIQIDVDPTDTLGDIKKQLENESGIPWDNQRLFKEGDELADDEKTARDHGIKEGDILDLEPKKMLVNVEMPDGSRVPIEIAPEDTSKAIKDNIEAKTGMAAPRQVLKKDGAELPDGQSAKDMGLQDGDNLAVDVFTVPVTVKTMDGKEIKIDVDPTDLLGDMKKLLENESGIPWDNQRLYKDGNELADDNLTAKDHSIQAGDVLDLEPMKMMVNVDMPDGSKVPIEITPHDTSDSIKKKVEDQTGLAAPRQVLKHNGKELPKGRTVKDMGIHDGDNLGVDIFTVPVTVNTMDGKQIQIDVDPTDTLGSIKKQLEPVSGLQASNQRLYKAGNELADDKVTAKDHGIKAGDVLDLEPKTMNVEVEMPDGSSCKISVTPRDTPDDIKNKIQEKTGMAVPRQVLSHNGKELPKGRTAKDLGLDDGSKLKVDIFKIPITVDTMDGKKHRVMIDPTDTIGEIKKQLSSDIGLPADNQRVFMNDEELADDTRSAKDYGVKKGSELNSEPKSIRVSVQLPDGNVITLFVKPSDKAGDIKAQVEDKTGLAVIRQLLKQKLENKDWLLPLNSTVKHLGMQDGAELFVEIHTIPIVVRTKDGEKSYDLDVEPSGSLNMVKRMLQKETGIDVKKQVLIFNEEEITDTSQAVSTVGIKAHSVVVLDTIMDAIVFVDIKFGTLFAMDRDEVVEKAALTPNQGNKMDFLEASKDGATRDKILKAMKESKTLGFAPQVVVEKLDVEDYDLEEAEAVKSMWGVSLKKREKNKKGEEFIFIDPKSGACGELSRQKFIDNKFITVIQTEKGPSLAEAETDTMLYDKYIHDIRDVFGVKSAK